MWRGLCVLQVVLLAACASAPDRAAAPRVTLDSLVPGAESGTVDMQFILENNRDGILQVTGLRYRLELDGVEFAWGVNRQAVDIPPRGEAQFDVTAPGKLPQHGHGHLHWSLSGAVLTDKRPAGFPFMNNGELNYLTGPAQ